MQEEASRSARILIAEDDELNRRATFAVLVHLGYCVDVVSNGKEVLQALDCQTYDIILMNLRMPEMSGLEATRRIRATIPKNRQPKIIAITAYATPECRDICFEAGMDDFILKPVKMEYLANALANALKRHIQLSSEKRTTSQISDEENCSKLPNGNLPFRLTSLMDLERQQPFS